MGVGDQDGLDPLALDRRKDRREMGRVRWARIDDGDRALADNIGAGAVEGEGGGVRRDEAAHARRKPRQFARRRLPRIGEQVRFAFISHSPLLLRTIGRSTLVALS